MPRCFRSKVAGILVTVMLAAGCAVPVFNPDGDHPAGVAPPAPDTGVSWQACPQIPRDLFGRTADGMTYECGSISVPRDWQAPQGGGTYSIALLRVRAQDQANRIGSLVLNPGGPGGSGINLAVYLTFGQLSAEISQRFDIIGFDPRGVGRSSPVECISDAEHDAAFGADPDPVTQPEFDEIVALDDKVGQACAAKYGDQLRLFSTEQTARDMDAIRAAVGDEKLNYLGYSYGTLLGATYAQLFPARIRALVLDGAVNPTSGSVAGSEEQARGFERAFSNFATWCRTTPKQCPIAPDARKAVTDTLAKAEASPIPYPDGREATDGWVFTAIVSSLYSEDDWKKLAPAIERLRRGDPSEIFKLADSYSARGPDGSYTNLFDANLVVNCADNTDIPTVAQVRQLQGEWRKKYPLFGAALATDLLSCTGWPTTAHDPYPTGPAVGAPPILVVGTTGDPATPYENTAKLASMLGTGRVLTWEGEGHTAYPSTPCIVRAVDAYLIDLTVPQEGLRCPAR